MALGTEPFARPLFDRRAWIDVDSLLDYIVASDRSELIEEISWPTGQVHTPLAPPLADEETA